jgi:asparagine N-glycosylation enzyme membrane subunit Stt3
MVATGTKLKAKIEAKIFKKPPASDITIYTITTTSNTMSGYYGVTQTSTTSTTTIGVPYAFTKADQQYYNFGTDKEGETRIALKANAVVKKGDLITITSVGSKTYEVQEINEYPYHNVNLAIIVTVREKLQ